MNADFRDFITFWQIFEIDIFYRKIAKNFRTIIHQMCVRFVVGFKIIFAIWARDFSEQIFFKHFFNIAINRRTTNFGMNFLNLLKNIISRKMAAMTSFQDDFSILMSSHARIMHIFSKKSRAIMRQILIINLTFEKKVVHSVSILFFI